MSMNAIFIQVNADELARIEANPSLAETLFQDGPAMPPVFGELSKKMEDRVRTSGPQMLAGVLANLDPRLREQLEQRLGGTAQQFAAGGGGEALLKVMQERRARAMGAMQMSNKQRNKLSLGKDWHGVHYLLSGLAEPAESLLSQAVLGGKPLGDDDEGFSGYGPARYFNVRQVAKVTASLNQPEVETDARARFNSDEMNRLQIYPGWRSEDAEELMNAVRRLREFFASATDNGNAIVTCLV